MSRHYSIERVKLCCVLALLAAVLPTCGLAQARKVWKIEEVNHSPGSDVGAYAALAIDRTGNFHIGYYDATHGSLLYSFREKNGKQWYTTKVDQKGAGTYVSLAVDSSGHPHFAYVSRHEDGLHYATWDGAQWHRHVLDTEHINYYTSIQVDKQGHPRISYYLYHAPDGSYILHLKLASFDGERWTIETVDKRRGTGKFSSLALDGNGYPHIAYSHVSLGDLLYAAWDGSQWNFGDADSRRIHNDYVGVGNSIALDQSGKPQIAYFDTTLNLVKFAFRQDGQWKTEIVDRLASRGEVDHVSLKIDSLNHPHLAYYDGGTGVLKYATRDGDRWHTEIVDNSGNVGKYPSLSLDEEDQPHIAYYGLDSNSLLLAHLEGTTQASVGEVK